MFPLELLAIPPVVAEVVAVEGGPVEAGFEPLSKLVTLAAVF